ncbi:MAG: S8 family serine peptidase [candidate division WOR-3 bacterium]|nr:S8 family serine peptidase [candidate division WOR-3 bacterium]
MSGLLSILIFTIQFYRAPEPVDITKIDRDIVWVYFTDKGFRTEAEYYQILKDYEPKISSAAKKRRLSSLGKVYDYDDLPVYTPYIEELIARGAKLRVISNWLNAASFYIPQELLGAIVNLPFIYDIKPVATEKIISDELSPLELKAQTADTSYYRELYNLSYDQNYMLGVPQVFTKGYTGSGIKLALLDTGLKRRHNALRSLRIYKEHDFLSGDDIFIKRPYENLQPILQLSNIKMLQSLRFLKTTPNRLFVFFSADSFTPTQPRPARLLMSYSDNLGESWSTPRILYLAPTYNISIPKVAVAAKDSLVYYFWQELIPQAPNVPINNLYFSYLINTTPQPYIQFGYGKEPELCVKNNWLFFSYVLNDSILYFRKADITNLTPSFYSPQQVSIFNEAIANPLIVIDSLNQIELFVRGLRSQRLYQFTSTNGINFTSPVVIDSQVGITKAFTSNEKIYLLYKKYLPSGKTELVLRISNNAASSWQDPIKIIENALSLGDYDAVVVNDTVKIVYEYQNDIYLLSVYNNTISEAQLYAQDFCYAPRILLTSSGPTLIFVRRGDHNTDYEENEDFSEQPNHGTHMASIIAGYLPKTFIGVAPAVDLIVAKTELHKAISAYTYETIIEEDLWICGLEWAEKEGAQIVSSSLGYRSWYTDKDFDGRTIPVSVAAGLAAKRG